MQTWKYFLSSLQSHVWVMYCRMANWNAKADFYFCHFHVIGFWVPIWSIQFQIRWDVPNLWNVKLIPFQVFSVINIDLSSNNSFVFVFFRHFHSEILDKMTQFQVNPWDNPLKFKIMVIQSGFFSRDGGSRDVASNLISWV